MAGAEVTSPMIQLYCPDAKDGFCRYPEGSTIRLSLLDWAVCEAHRHVWWESEKQRRDLGQMAWLDWKKHQWPLFLGHRRKEHLLGYRNWVEFPDNLHGIVHRMPKNLMLSAVVSMLEWGRENLFFLNFFDNNQLRQLMVGELPTLCSPRPEEELLRLILEKFHLNDMRPDFPDVPVPPPSGCYGLAG
jgi:hypothetical protein